MGGYVMKKKSSIVWGLIFILLGGAFLLKNFGIWDVYLNIFNIGYIISTFWPALFLILPAIAMHSGFFSGKGRDAGVLVPAGILLTIGIVAQLSTLYGLWGVLWPGFILAVAVGLFEMYLFGSRDKGLLIPVGILSFLSLIFFVFISSDQLFGGYLRQLFIPVLFILLGVLIIFRNSFLGKE